MGPFVAASERRALALWAAKDAERRVWWTSPLSGPDIHPLRVGVASASLDLVTLAPRGTGDEDGFVAVSSSSGGTRTVDVLLLGPAGELVAGPVRLDEPTSEVLWVEALATSEGSVILWALESEDGTAALSAATLDARGHVTATPHEVARGARAWQAVSTRNGLALGWTQAGEEGAGVNVALLDARGLMKGNPVVVAARGAEGDLDLLPVEGGCLVAWTDDTHLDLRVALARLAEDGRVQPVDMSALPATSDQVLLGLVAGVSGGDPWLMWNDPQSPHNASAVRIESLDARGRPTGMSGYLNLEGADGALPELVARKGGLAALGIAPQCAAGSPCEGYGGKPMAVLFDGALSALADRVSASSLGDGLALAWGLHCRGEGCSALAAGSDQPTSVAITELRPRAELPWAAGRFTNTAIPRIVESRSVAEVEPLADLDAAELAGGELAAWVTVHFTTTPWKRLDKPASDGRREPLDAELGVTWCPSGSPCEPAAPLSLRARSRGGVDLAVAHDQALLAWSAMDEGKARVFATLLGPKGQKLSQRMVTRRSEEVSDVAASPLGDGWVLAWVDERDGDPEVYAARLDSALRLQGQELRVGKLPGDAMGVTLQETASGVVAAWAEEADPSEPGLSSIYATLLGGNLQSAPTPWRLSHGQGRAFAPSLAVQGDHVVLAWVEDAPEGHTDQGGRLLVASLSQDGQLREAPAVLQLEPGELPTNLALQCDAARCRLLLSVTGAKGPRELALTRDASGALSPPTPLTALAGPAARIPALVVTGVSAWLTDRVVWEKERVRRQRLLWSR